MKQKVVLLLGLLLLVFAAACGASATPSAISRESIPPQPPAGSSGYGSTSDQAKSQPGGVVPAQAPAPGALPAAAADRMIIRTANLSPEKNSKFFRPRDFQPFLPVDVGSCAPCPDFKFG